jgi:hypothetical protein
LDRKKEKEKGMKITSKRIFLEFQLREKAHVKKEVKGFSPFFLFL